MILFLFHFNVVHEKCIILVNMRMTMKARSIYIAIFILQNAKAIKFYMKICSFNDVMEPIQQPLSTQKKSNDSW